MKQENSTEQSLGVLIVGHGSRDANSNREFEALVQRYRILRPDLDVRWCYTELAQPETRAALGDFSAEKKKIVVLPLFLFSSGHIKNDLPLIVNQLKPRYPNTEVRVAQSFGVHPKLVRLLFERTGQAVHQSRKEQEKTGVIVVNRGSSDPDANSDFHKTVRLFEEGNGYAFVFPSFIGITEPRLTRSLELAAKLRPERLLVIPYFLFGGRLIRRIEAMTKDFSAQYPWIRTDLAPYLTQGLAQGLAQGLGEDPVLFSLMDEKIADAVSGAAPLPCVTCEYRQRLPGLADQVGGLRAMLWSIRHMETHSQAIPHEFPHRNLRKHVLVCGNADCAGRGSISLVTRLRALIKEQGRQREFRITRTSCMGRCGEGPAVVVYPDGVWYQRVQPSDAEELVSGHLFNDRLLSRLVDNIM